MVKSLLAFICFLLFFAIGTLMYNDDVYIWVNAHDYVAYAVIFVCGFLIYKIYAFLVY